MGEAIAAAEKVAIGVSLIIFCGKFGLSRSLSPYRLIPLKTALPERIRAEAQ